MDDMLTPGTRIKVNETTRLESLRGLKGTVVATRPDGSYLAWVDQEAEAISFYRSEIDVHVDPTPVRVRSREQLLELKTQLGVRDDWHEPSEQSLTVKVDGHDFDNAGHWWGSSTGKEYEELHVKLFQDGDLVAVVNLATLFAWATGHGE
jgi:hypothetical protein